MDRYDDRDDVRTNLISSYERIIAFGEKHLPDPFYLEGTQRVSIRNKIFRELASNILMHREFSNPFPAKIIIEKERVYAENANNPHGHGKIDPNNFSPYPKNPVIVRVFKEIGFADELGSGIRNLMKYVKIYSGKNPELIENDIFKVIIPLTTEATTEARVNSILKFCIEPKSSTEIMAHIGLQNKEHFRKDILNPLIAGKKLFLSIPDKPKSPNQKYYHQKED